MAIYLGLPNYVNNLRRLGWGDDDLDGLGSDKLVDAIVVWGDESAIRTRVDEHFAAGADHVCVQVLHRRPDRAADGRSGAASRPPCSADRARRNYRWSAPIRSAR